MGEIGQVIKKDNNKVTVRLTRTEACAKCGACSAGLKSQDMMIEAANLCDAEINDNVEIMLEESDFIKAVAIMYGIPFVSFVIGLIGGYYISMAVGFGNNEIIGFSIGIIFVLITYFLIKKNEKHWKSKNFIPKAVKVAKKHV